MLSELFKTFSLEKLTLTFVHYEGAEPTLFTKNSWLNLIKFPSHNAFSQLSEECSGFVCYVFEIYVDLESDCELHSPYKRKNTESPKFIYDRYFTS